MQVALQSSFIRHLANVKHPLEMLPSSRGEQDCPDCFYPAPPGALPFPPASGNLQKPWCFPGWMRCHMQRPITSGFLGIHSRHESQGIFVILCLILSSPETWWFSSKCNIQESLWLFAVFLKTQPGCWLIHPGAQMGMRVFRCCLLYKLAWCRVVNLGKPSGKANSLSENMDDWLHEPSVSENVGMWVLSACEYSARRFGVPVPAITAAVCFIKQEEGEDLISSRIQVEQQPAAGWPCSEEKLFWVL